LLTAIGLYGVVSYLVVSRTGDMAIRIALGATQAQIHREVLAYAGRLVGGGIAIGAIASLLFTAGAAHVPRRAQPGRPHRVRRGLRPCCSSYRSPRAICRRVARHASTDRRSGSLE
jgi:hypothetical protein